MAIEQRGERGFSAAAEAELVRRVDEYVEDLVGESARIARRERSDTVSAAQVERAGQTIGAGGASRRLRIVGYVGGLLAGAGLSSLTTMLGSEEFTTTGVLATIGCLVFGAAALVAQFMRD